MNHLFLLHALILVVYGLIVHSNIFGLGDASVRGIRVFFHFKSSEAL